MNKSNQQVPLYNSRGINVYVKLLNQRYPHVNIREVLNYAKMAPYEVADQAHWFTQKQINRFYEKCVQLSGNENIALGIRRDVPASVRGIRTVDGEYTFETPLSFGWGLRMEWG